MRPNRVVIQGHFKYLGSIMQGNGGQDREIQRRINAASQFFRSLKKSVCSQLLSRHRVKWLGHAARKPEITMVKHLLFADSIPGRPLPVGCPHYTWMYGAIQNLSTLGPRLQGDLLRDSRSTLFSWPQPQPRLNLFCLPGLETSIISSSSTIATLIHPTVFSCILILLLFYLCAMLYIILILIILIIFY